ncbi:MAG: hypothetical protein H7332_12795 [Bdellovibrionales bacterium]|nr:hypothetical protein [Ramlibacter sp.]
MNPRPLTARAGASSKIPSPPVNKLLAGSQGNMEAIAAVLEQVYLPDPVVGELAQLGLFCRPAAAGADTGGDPQRHLDTIEYLLNHLCKRARAHGMDSYRAATLARDTVMTAVMGGASSATVDVSGGLEARLAQLGFTCHAGPRKGAPQQAAPENKEGPELAAVLAASRHVLRGDPLHGPGGAPRLLQALTQGDAAAVTAFMESLQGRGQGPGQIADIVAARRSDKAPGLYCALQDGNAAAVAAYMLGLKGLGLSTEQIADIACARDVNGYPGLYWAMRDGRATTVTAFMNGLKELGLSTRQLEGIALARDMTGIPGLSAALYDRKTAVVAAYLAGLKGLGLHSGQVVRTTMAKDLAGRPGLYIALRDGRAAAVPAYLEGLKGLGLSPRQIGDIVLAMDIDGCPGLALALHGGHTAAVTAFMNGLKDLGLDPQQVADIALAADPAGRTGLQLARERGHADAEKAYVEGLAGLQQHKLMTPRQIADLVKPKDKPQW